MCEIPFIFALLFQCCNIPFNILCLLLSEKNELLSDRSDDLVRNDLESIESDSLRNRSALTSDKDITFSDGEARRNVNGNVSVSLLVSVVLSNVVQVIFSDDDSLVHLGGND